MPDHAIVVEGLTKTFGRRGRRRGRGKSDEQSVVEALRGVDLTVERGTVLGVLGPNGAGKTTAVRILTTLLPPTAGRALVEGRDVVRDAAAVRSVIGLAGQSTAIVDELTGRENLEMVGRLHHAPRDQAGARADELLERFDLADAGGRQAKTYSGGMLRRLDLAASLVAHPAVLFLDEPTTGLDPRSRFGMWDVIRNLVAEGTTLLLTTQYLDEADELADRIVVIDHGLVIAEGTSDELKGRVGGDVVEFTVPDRSRLAAAAQAVAGLAEGAPPSTDGHSGTISLRVGARGSDALVETVRRLDAAGVDSAGLTLRRPSLDDVFLALTGRVAEESQDLDEEGGGVTVESLRWATNDAWVLTWRNLAVWRRVPSYLVFTVVQPMIFTILFRFVFGGAIPTDIPGGYVNFLLPGVIGQTAAFATMGTAIALAAEAQKGYIDRLRVMPIARSAVLLGRLAADGVRFMVTLLVIIGVGYAVGFRFNDGLGPAVGMFLLAELFALGMCCISMFIGLAVRQEEAVQALGMIWLFPLTFISSAFVPVETMPGWLQAFAVNQPITHVINALRSLALGTPMGDNLWLSLVWITGIVAVFVPLSVRAYKRVS